MNTNKFLIGTIVGGIAFFFLGYLIYGVALTSFFSQHSMAATGLMKTMAEIVWWALIVGNLARGALLTYILLKIGNVNSFGRGASISMAVGFFMTLSMVLTRYATENTSDLTGTLTDVIVETLMCAIAGGLIGAVLGMGKKKA